MTGSDDPHPIALTGRDLTPESIAEIARRDAAVQIAPAAIGRMQGARSVVLGALEAGRPVYGLTTGLGQRLDERVEPAEAADFSLRTLRGRAVAVGEPLDRELVRAAMVVRLNGLCAGGSGASVNVAQALRGLLNARVHPVLPRAGSVGAADICMLAFVGLALVGEGLAEIEGQIVASDEALARAGLRPIELGPKDGLAICSSSAVSVGTSALALLDAREQLRVAQVAAALSMEGFRSNLSPIDPRAAEAHPAPGQRWSASGLRRLLAGGALSCGGGARRLQDPLSFRCASHVHGSLYAALELLERAVEAELNAAADNPLVVQGDVISTGNFHTPALALALDAAAIAVAQVASLAVARPARLAAERLSGLPVNLVAPRHGRSGVGPLQKAGEALLAEIRHLAAPLAIHQSSGGDGVEDDSTNAVQAALRLRDQLERLRRVLAIELICAAQAIDLAAPERLGGGTAAAHRCIRQLVAPLAEDRPLGADVERLRAQALDGGRLLELVDGALS